MFYAIYWFDIAIILAIRWFIFEFYLFSPLWTYMKSKHYLFNKFLSCPFCQTFWTTLIVLTISHGFQVNYLVYGIVIGWFSYLVHLGEQSLIKYVYENN